MPQPLVDFFGNESVRSAHHDVSGWRHILSLRAFWTLYDGHGNLLAFRECLASGSINGAVMHKDIFAAFSFNETKTLFFVEPFHCSGN
jgi:hypothetical protein